MIEFFIKLVELVVGFFSHTVKLMYFSSAGIAVISVEDWLGRLLFKAWHLLDIFLALCIVLCSFDVAASKLITLGVSELDRAKVTHFRTFKVSSISDS